MVLFKNQFKNVTDFTAQQAITKQQFSLREIRMYVHMFMYVYVSRKTKLNDNNE